MPTGSKKSTIVRAGMLGLRAGFAAAEHLAPGLGARVVERLWFRAPGRRRRIAPDGGEPFEVTSQGHVVRGRRWGSGPVVYLVHGWGGHAAQLSPFVAPLVAAGYAVVAHDAPSHGHSDPGPSGPHESHGIEFGMALDAVATRHGPAHAVVAHSMGALATTLTLRYGWLGAGRLAFLAPMTELTSHLDDFQRLIGLGPRTRERFVARASRRVDMAFADIDIARLAAGIDRPPLLVVHDRRDRETRYDGSAALVRDWPGARLVTTLGLGHRRLLADPGVVDTVTGFVTAEPATAGSPRGGGARDSVAG